MKPIFPPPALDEATDPASVLRGLVPADIALRVPLSVRCLSPRVASLCSKMLSAAGYARISRDQQGVEDWKPVTLRCWVVSCNRPDRLVALLGDLERSARAWARVRVYDDSSTVDMSAARELAERSGIEWCTVAGGPHGRQRFWELWNAILADGRAESEVELFLALVDDIRLCPQFFDRALGHWNGRPVGKGAAINLFAERRRDMKAQWTGFTPKRVTSELWQTQWIDGGFICHRGTFESLGWAVQKPPTFRWRDPTASSGVWQNVSVRLHAAGHAIYRVDKSLVVHVLGPSVMHPEYRRSTIMVARDFVGGEALQSKLTACERVEASLASIPSRASTLKQVVQSLLPQVDVVRVYLNGYKNVPAFLQQEGIVVERSQDHGDFGDAGKFYWCEQASGYQLTCDDDMVYPPDYVRLLLEGIERYGRKAAVTMHGAVLRPPIESYYQSRRVYHLNAFLQQDMPCHVAGTGVLGYHCSTVKLYRDDFKLPNMADIWFALACERQGVPRIVVRHDMAQALRYLNPPTTIYNTHVRRDGPQTEAVRSIEWKKPELPKG